MKSSHAIAIGIALTIGAAVALGFFGTAHAPITIEGEPTDFVEVGTLAFSGPGDRQDEGSLTYADGAASTTVQLTMDALSVCGGGSGATPCMAMSVLFSNAFDGKRALIEGTREEDGSVLIRKLRILDAGEMERAYEPGHVFVSWPRAVELIQNCEVEMITQTHALDVYLKLKDGQEVVAIEPTIDTVFQMEAATREKCGSIPLATE